jgi:hypothetical protein
LRGGRGPRLGRGLPASNRTRTLIPLPTNLAALPSKAPGLQRFRRHWPDDCWLRLRPLAQRDQPHHHHGDEPSPHPIRRQREPLPFAPPSFFGAEVRWGLCSASHRVKRTERSRGQNHRSLESLQDASKSSKPSSRIETRKRAFDARRNRREDTCLEILVGAIVLAKVGQVVIEASTQRGVVQGALKRPDDRALFDL